MAPPRLSAQSAERMQNVLGRADDLVDAGTAPNQALAKAAREFALPVSHVPKVVHAFNTGRSVRQFGEDDPWQKAAAYPVATAEGVVEALTHAEPVKRAADLSDYHAPPTSGGWVPFPVAPLAPPREKVAAAPEPAPAPTPAVKAAVDSRLSATRSAAMAFDHAVAVAAALKPAQYSAAKQAALRAHPDAAAFFFAQLEDAEHGHRDIYKLAAASAHVPFDATVRNDHPLVIAIRDLETAKAAHVAQEAAAIPFGYERITEFGGRVVFRKLATCPVLGTPIEPIQAQVPPPPAPRDPVDFDLPKYAAAPQGSPPVTPPVSRSNYLGRTFDDFANKKMTTGFGQGFQAMVGIPSKVLGSSFAGKPMSDIVTPNDDDLRGKATKGLDANLGSVDQHASIQDMLADPRFSAADPKLLVDTYRDLSTLAPQAMRNRSVASDFVQRRMQTGPLSYYDLKTLTEIEKNLAAVRKDQSAGDDD